MILCSCNQITDHDVRKSAKPCGASADKARDVFRSKGCLPKCGRCVRNIQASCERAIAAKIEARLEAAMDAPVFAIAAE